MICPNCNKQVPDGPDCPACGIVISKYRERRQAPVRGATGPAVQGAPQAIDSAPERPWPFRPVSDGVLSGVYGQLARMLEAGISLTEALAIVSRRSRGRLREAFTKVREAVTTGSTLAAALSLDPALFPGRVRSLVEAGERTGGLPAVFRSLGESYELRLKLRRRILRACLYPFILFTLSFFLLPLSKLILGGLGAYLKASLVPYLLALAFLALVIIVLPWGLRKIIGPAAGQRIVRALPLVGRLARLRVKSSFCRHLASSLGAGLDLNQALRLSASATGEIALVAKIEQAILRVGEGSTLSEAFGEQELFDDDFMLAVSSGELSGKLTEALDQQARLGQESFLHRLEVSVQLLAVLVLLLVYAFVVFSVLSKYNNVLGGYQKQIDEIIKGVGGGGQGMDQLMKEIGGNGAGALPAELKDILH